MNETSANVAARYHEYGPPSVLTVEPTPISDPGEGEVRVRVEATSVNPVDCMLRAGRLRLLVRAPLPRVTGMDLAGVVDAVGPGVEVLVPGDSVWGTTDPARGTCQRFAIAREQQLAPRPVAFPASEAAALAMVAATAYQALVHTAALGPGDRVLILGGSGGVGSAAIQLAKHLGATVSVTCSARNETFVRGLGASHVIDYRSRDPAEVLPPQDVVLDAVGSQPWTTVARTLRPGGRLIRIALGVAPAVERHGVYVGTGLALGRILVAKAGGALGSRSVTHLLRTPSTSDLNQLARLAEQGALKAPIEETYAFEDLRRAHEHVATHRTRGKVVVLGP